MIDDDNDELSPEDVARMQAYLDHIDARINAPYDGVLGRLPDWVPDWHQQEFFKARNSLLNGGRYGDPVNREQIIEWMDAYCRLGNTPEGQVSRDYIPIERMDPIGQLAHYRYAVSRGELKGLELLGGGDAVAGWKSRTGHTKRDDHKNKIEFQNLIRPHLGGIKTIHDLATLPGNITDFLKWYGKPAIRGWINEIAPGQLQRGRPKTNK